MNAAAAGGEAWGGRDDSLAVRGVDLRRGDRHALKAVTLRARPGRLLALAGPNGAGKSSLLGVLAGVLAPTRGEATLDGRALARWSPTALARRRAMLSQDVGLDFAFRVDEVAMLGRSPHGRSQASVDDRRVVDAALRAAHVWHLRERDYLALSGGEQRRVQLARVLAQVWECGEGTPWLLLDEPEAGLDIAHQHFMLRRARLLACQGFGVIAVLHDLNLVARYADEVALLAQGRLVRHGSPDEALAPAVLSEVYGLPLRRVAIDGEGWLLAPA